jgi:CHAT domain-containing protein/Tfp pilus assembly protein PilF
MLTQMIDYLIPNCSVRKSLGLSRLLVLLLCLQCAQSANAQALSDGLQSVAAARQNPVAEELDKLKFVGHPQQNPQEVTTLELGKPIERELAGEQKHAYQITLAEGQYASVIVEQRGIDLVVQLLGAGGKSIADFDTEIRIQGEEKIEVVAEVAGSYRLLVRARYPRLPAGRYEVRLAELRIATDKDRSLEEARKLTRESNRVLGEGKPNEARPLAERALAIREEALGPDHVEVASTVNTLANIHYQLDDYNGAEVLFERALAIREKTLSPDHPDLADSMAGLAIVYYVEGKYSRVKPLYDRALEIKEQAFGPDHPEVGRVLNRLANMHFHSSDYVQAELLYRRCLTIYEKSFGENDPMFAKVLGNLANVYTELGDYAKAEPMHQRAMEIVEKLDGPDSPGLGTSLIKIGNLYNNMGEYAKAAHVFQRALRILEKLGPHEFGALVALSNLADAYLQQGEYAKAEPLFQRALAGMEELHGSEHPRVARIMNSLANLYRAQGDYSKAEPLYRRALEIFEKALGIDHPDLVETLKGLAILYRIKGDIAQSVAYQTRLETIIERNINYNLVVGSERQKLAYLASLSEETDRTLSLHIQTAPDNLNAEVLAATAVLQRKGRVLDYMTDSLAALRQRSSAEDQVQIEQLNQITSQLATLVLDGPQKISLAEHQQKIRTLEEHREKLENEISRGSAGFYQRPNPVTFAAVQTAIPPDAALIEFAIYRPFDPKTADNKKAFGEPRYVAYIVRRQAEVRWKELGEAKVIDGAIDALRAALRDPKRRDVERLARTVDEKIMQPVRPLLGDATQLLISPDGALNLIPFEALVDDQNRYLVERFSCTYLTSGRDLLRLQVAREAKSKPLVVANPSFGEPPTELLATTTKPTAPGSRRRSVTTGRDLSEVYFAPLGGTAEEARSIQTLFPDANVLTGAQATESAVKQINAPRVLHLATHGFFLSEPGAVATGSTAPRGTSAPKVVATGSPAPRGTSAPKVVATGSPAQVTTTTSNTNTKSAPKAVATGPPTQVTTRGISANSKIANPLLRSGLALAGANLHHNSNDDGILTALEASGLNLWGTKLVVLSACDTGVGEVRNGEGVYGLRRAFVLAGAESLVMSLWPVSDYTTRELMTNYYRNLKQGMGRGESLRQVQLDMLKRNPKLHPFYWANFIQSGEWANLDGKR